MEFANPEKTCTNCRGCDDICPFNLLARFESKGPDSTNCNLCAEVCAEELGEGDARFHLVAPEPTDGRL
jgi:MinD superfamily P-loop ATPase